MIRILKELDGMTNMKTESNMKFQMKFWNIKGQNENNQKI